MSEEQLQNLDERAAFTAAVLDIVQTAKRAIWIGSQRLERDLYGSAEFSDALKKFALSSDFAEARILVREPAAALRESPMLIALARRMRSRVHLRQPANPQGEFDEEWVLNDEGAHFYRRQPDDRQATFGNQALFETRKHITRFEALWDAAVPSVELRELGI